jgi:surface protein
MYINYTFGDATSFNQDIRSWDVSRVTNMSFMFKDATSSNQGIGSWIIGSLSRVKDMTFMFSNASSLNQVGMTMMNMLGSLLFKHDEWNAYVDTMRNILASARKGGMVRCQKKNCVPKSSTHTRLHAWAEIC